MVLVPGARNDPEFLVAAECREDLAPERRGDEVVLLAVDDDGGADDAPRGGERVEAGRRKLHTSLHERDEKEAAGRGEETRDAGGVRDVDPGHRAEVSERGAEPEGANGRVCRRRVKREKRSHRSAVEGDQARIEAEAARRLGEKPREILRFPETVRDPCPARRGMSSKLGNKDVQTEAEGPDGIAPPLRGVAPFTVKKNHRSAPVWRPGRGGVRDEARRLGGIAVEVEGLVEAAGAGRLAEGDSKRLLALAAPRTALRGVAFEVRRREEERG